MNNSDPAAVHRANQRFDTARRKETFQEIFRLISKRSPDLLSFDEVQAALKSWQHIESRISETIPLDKIVGSVGRYRDFTREFLPRASVNKDRWKAVDVAMHSQLGLPPIEVYQVGEIYFVKDGNHRVSVARANGLTDIDAYVTRVETLVTLTADTLPEELALKAAYADFLRDTGLERLRPGSEIEVTEIRGYHELLEHIAVHRYYMGLEQDREIAPQEAVVSWYDYVYLPVAAAVWASDVLDRFPQRTAADLYLWVCRHREDVADHDGNLPSPVETVTELSHPAAEGPSVVATVKKAIAGKPKSVDLASEAVQKNRLDAAAAGEEED